MTRAETKAFRKTLESRQTELRNGSKGREALEVESSPDELDRIQRAAEREYAIGSLERDFNRLREVSEALLRIEEGTFGVCLSCEEEIMPKRLAAVPWARLCIVCQEAADRDRSSAHQMEEAVLITAQP